MAEETLPILSKTETLKYYTQNESYKGLAWASLSMSTFTALYYGLSKKYPRLKELISKKTIAKGIITTYILAQLINLKSYHTLATTSDISKFNVKDNDHNTKFYFKLNFLDILIKRLIKDGEECNKPIEYYQKILLHYDLSILTRILKSINNDKKKINNDTTLRFIKIAIENINNAKIILTNKNTSLAEWGHIFYILSISPLHRKKRYNNVIKEKIKFFDQENLIADLTENSLNVENNRQVAELIHKNPFTTISKESAWLYNQSKNIESQIINEEALIKAERS